METIKFKYYHGEETNPYEEINENQGAHAMRYNPIASKLWCFEYHCENGWDKYKKLEVRMGGFYFEHHKEPQKDFTDINDALHAFFRECGNQYPLLATSSKRLIDFIYSNAMHERFYSPLYNVIDKKDMPSYLLYYHGESKDPWESIHTHAGTHKSFWWRFEMNWYTSSESITEKDWRSHLESYLMRNSLHTDPSKDEYKTELEHLLQKYKSFGTK